MIVNPHNLWAPYTCLDTKHMHKTKSYVVLDQFKSTVNYNIRPEGPKPQNNH